MKKILILVVCVVFISQISWSDHQQTPTHKQSMPRFLWGVGTSAQQVEGNCNNNSWAVWEEHQLNLPQLQRRIPEEMIEKAGSACDHWNTYKEDIQIMKNELGVNSYRFSVEWSKVQPRKPTANDDGFDQEALDHYALVCAYALSQGIEPVIMLHHYTDPIWFAQLGGFTKTQNSHYFVSYCQQTIEALQQTGARIFFTFNSPDAYATACCLRGSKPAYIDENKQPVIIEKNKMMTAQMIFNLLDAHVKVYRTVKPEYGDNIQIGITKNIYQLDPYGPLYPLGYVACFFGNRLVNNPYFDFFKTGTFSVWFGYYKQHNPQAAGALDMIGLNYYSRGYIKDLSGPICDPTEEKTDNARYTVYPEGLGRALHEVAQLEVPIYVMENGIATTDDTRRISFLNKYLKVLMVTKEEFKDTKHPVNGYFHWSYIDNYEWGNYDMQYGLVTRDKQVKESGSHYQETIAALSALH